MTAEIAWNATVCGWRALAGLPAAAFAWERNGPADCFWWVGEAGVMAHQVFLESPSNLRDVLASPNRPPGSDIVVRGIDTAEFFDALGELESESESAPLMRCDLLSRHVSVPTGFDTALLAGEQRTASLQLLAAVYGDPGGLTAFFQGPGVAEVVGVYDENRLIACATVVSAGSSANIWSVATAKDARGRGAASAAVQAALRHAAARGYSNAVLGTADELVPWYGRFGFVEVGRERTARIVLS